MTYYPLILIDTGVLVAYYSARDKYHAQVSEFMENCTSQLITTIACITETMQLLSSRWQVQNEFLIAVANGVFACEELKKRDFFRIAELNAQYSDLPADLADLSLIVVSERLDIPAIATLDKDFNIYRRYRKQPFERVF